MNYSQVAIMQTPEGRKHMPYVDAPDPGRVLISVKRWGGELPPDAILINPKVASISRSHMRADLSILAPEESP